MYDNLGIFFISNPDEFNQTETKATTKRVEITRCMRMIRNESNAIERIPTIIRFGKICYL
jgi:hypothetical protein